MGGPTVNGKIANLLRSDGNKGRNVTAARSLPNRRAYIVIKLIVFWFHKFASSCTKRCATYCPIAQKRFYYVIHQSDRFLSLFCRGFAI